MTRPTTDLRDELHRQARETESWDLPALPRPQRRTSPWRAGGAVLVAAAVVAVLVLTPAWWSRDEPDRQGPAAGTDGPRLSNLGWRAVGPRCLADLPECEVPSAVRTRGRELARTGLTVQEEAGAPNATARLVVDVPTSAGRTSVMVGVVGAGERRTPRLHVFLQVVGVELRSEEGPMSLLGLEAPDLPDPLPVEVEADWMPSGSRLFVATFAEPDDGPRSDWDATSARCRAATLECVAPETLQLGGANLDRSADGAQARGDLQAEFRQPQSGVWFMLGTTQPDDGGPLLVSVGGTDEVAVPVDKPVLLRLPDGAPPTYRVRTEDGRPLPLFMQVYRLAEG